MEKGRVMGKEFEDRCDDREYVRWLEGHLSGIYWPEDPSAADFHRWYLEDSEQN